MKRKNPYVWLTIIWAATTVLNLTASVVRYIVDDIGGGTFHCCCAVGFAFVTGTLCARWREVAEWNKNVRFLEQAREALGNFIEELKKEEENRPFKEFDSSSDVPFPEVRGDKNGK